MKPIIALITAAGLGKRLGAVTKAMNKALLKIEGKPLIRHITDRLKSEGIRDIVVVTGFQGEQLAKALDKDKGVRTVYNPFYRVTGILASFWAARPELDGRPFLFTTSDHFFMPHVLRDCLRGKGDFRLVVERKRSYTREDAKVLIRNGQVTAIGKDLPLDKAQGEFGGMSFFSARASTLFYKELVRHFAKGSMDGYMMHILKAASDRHGIPIRYSLCGEDSRIEVDSVSDLIAARAIAGGRGRRSS